MFLTVTTSIAGAAFKLVGGLYIADLVSGVIHWMEDRYGDPDWPVLGHTVRENQQHHFTPRSFLGGNLWTRNREVLFIGLAFLAGFQALDWLSLVTISAVVFGVMSNEIHASAHRSQKENGPVLTALQKTGFMQSHAHHAAHHRKGKNSHYCMVTNHMNPIVEWTGVFRKLEWLIERVSGLTPRPDLSVNPRYRGV